MSTGDSFDSVGLADFGTDFVCRRSLPPLLPPGGMIFDVCVPCAAVQTICRVPSQVVLRNVVAVWFRILAALCTICLFWIPLILVLSASLSQFRQLLLLNMKNAVHAMPT